MNVLAKLQHITTVIMDMDGVLTDGGLLLMPNGEWVRRMNIKDGYALQLAVRKGYNVILVTGSFSAPVEDRLTRLGITEFYHHIADKAACIEAIREKHHLCADEMLFIGDDVPDISAMEKVGVGCCPPDAARDVLEIADYITSAKGGEGCVREILEKIMRVQGRWGIDLNVSST